MSAPYDGESRRLGLIDAGDVERGNTTAGQINVDRIAFSTAAASDRELIAAERAYVA